MHFSQGINLPFGRVIWIVMIEIQMSFLASSNLPDEIYRTVSNSSDCDLDFSWCTTNAQNISKKLRATGKEALVTSEKMNVRQYVVLS